MTARSQVIVSVEVRNEEAHTDNIFIPFDKKWIIWVRKKENFKDIFY